MELSSLTVAEALAGLRAKEFSSVELTRAVLDAIGRKDGALGAYLSVDAEGALGQAAAADAARAAGADGELLGIPLAVKDLINVKGQPCTCASRMLEGYVSPYDATVAARLRAAGAVFAGRTNMDEFAMGSTTENSAFKPARNPCDPSRVPGGSSGGSAAAVAGGEALAALGTDTGGSIRQPAAFCGCVGMKPSYGRVSRYGVTAYASSLDQVGPMTRTVGDAARILRVIAGHDPRDGTTPDVPVPDYPAAAAAAADGGMKGMRIGLPKEYFVEGSDAEVTAAVRDAAARCAEDGAELVEVGLPHTEYAVAVYYILSTAEASANLARFDGVRYGRRAERPEGVFDLYARSRAEGFGREVKRRIILGTYVLSSGYYDAYYGRAQRVRTLIAGDFEAAFKKCDALLAPVAPTPAYEFGAFAGDPLKMYLGDIFTVPANLAGLCGISLPCGRTAGGLPLAAQLLAAPFREETLFRAAAALERLLPASP